MAINNTTLKVAMVGYGNTIFVASTTNITKGIPSSGSGKTVLYIDNELMGVIDVPTAGVVVVERGAGGTQAVPHVVNSLVIIGGPGDFPQFAPKIGAFVAAAPDRFQGVSAPVAAAATIAAPGVVFHVTGTTATNIITPPTNFVEGTITIIADAAWTYVSSAVTNGIAVSGAASAGSFIDFTYDAATALWYPSPSKDSTAVGGATAAAATLVAPSPFFHVTGTTATNIITPPANFSDTAITIIADAIWTWTASTTVANGIAATGTVTTAKTSVTFSFDPVTALWYPSRVA